MQKSEPTCFLIESGGNSVSPRNPKKIRNSTKNLQVRTLNLGIRLFVTDLPQRPSKLAIKKLVSGQTEDREFLERRTNLSLDLTEKLRPCPSNKQRSRRNYGRIKVPVQQETQ